MQPKLHKGIHKKVKEVAKNLVENGASISEIVEQNGAIDGPNRTK